MTVFNVSEIIVTHTYHYVPDEYLNYCADNDVEPTECGFYSFILPEIHEDFPNNRVHPYTVVYEQ
jgi:hypothetical protein